MHAIYLYVFVLFLKKKLKWVSASLVILNEKLHDQIKFHY